MEDKNFFDKKITNRLLVVFKFNENNKIISYSKYNLNDHQDINYIKETTPNELIKRGLLEKIFGGVGPSIPN